MRVVHVVRGKANPQTLNGVNKAVHSLATEMLRAGVDVTVVGITATPDVIRHEHNYPLKLLAPWFFGRLPAAMNEVLSQFAPKDTVFHLHSVLIPEYRSLVGELRRRGYRWVLSPHGGYAKRGRRRHSLAKLAYFQLIERKLLRSAACLHATSNNEASELRSLAPAGRVVVIHNGQADLGPLPDPASRAGTAPVFGFCGRLNTAQKGLDTLIEGFALYVRAGGAGTLQLVGDGHDRRALSSLANSQGIANRVIFSGPLYDGELLRVMRSFDAFVHVSRWEGLPIAILEASALGLPLIATKETNVTEEISRHDAGIVVLQNEPARIAEALAEFEIAGSARHFRWSHGARAMAASFSWTTAAREMMRDVYGS